MELAPLEDGTYRQGFAGDTFNTVWHMAQLLGPMASVGYVSRVGLDSLSARLLQELVADGLDVSGIGRDDSRTMGLYLIELDGVERSFHYWRSASAAKHLADDRHALEQAVQQAGLIHVSGISLAILSTAARATLFDSLVVRRKTGAIIAFDPNIRSRLWGSADECRETVARMLTLTDIALPSFDDEAGLWGDASPAVTLARITSAGVPEIVVKDGAGPVHFQADRHSGVVQTPVVADIRDTTGAGDAFNAGYLAARLLGQVPELAIGLGQRLSAEVIATPGARAPKDRVQALGRLVA